MCAKMREEQIAEAEELLSDGLPEVGFAKGLFFGRFLNEKLQRYPHHPEPSVAAMAQELRQFCRERIDPVAIDRQARIPDDVIRGLGELGILGACLRARWAAAACRRYPTAG